MVIGRNRLLNNYTHKELTFKIGASMIEGELVVFAPIKYLAELFQKTDEEIIELWGGRTTVSEENLKNKEGLDCIPIKASAFIEISEDLKAAGLKKTSVDRFVSMCNEMSARLEEEGQNK